MAMSVLVERGTVVLVIDDEVELRNTLVDALVMEGYEALPVPSADAAVSELAHGAQPSVIILDLWVPGMSSAAFVRWLRASVHARLPVLVLSGAHALERIELDVDAVLRKPFDASALMRAVDKLVRRRPAIKSATAPRARAARARVSAS